MHEAIAARGQAMNEKAADVFFQERRVERTNTGEVRMGRFFGKPGQWGAMHVPVIKPPLQRHWY
jgi:hypothetical protein